MQGLDSMFEYGPVGLKMPEYVFICLIMSERS